MDDNRWQIHRHLAEHSDERLQLVRQVPSRIFLIGADADISRRLLSKRYPKADFVEYDSRSEFLRVAAQARKSGFWQKMVGKGVGQFCQNPNIKLPEAEADMLWANLSLICADDLVEVFQVWANALKTDGLLFFTHFGSESLRALRGRLKDLGVSCETPTLLDMHDVGDMLAGNGFYDPVMDTALLELSYRKAETFWQDMETLGLWSALKMDKPQVARDFVNQMFEKGETLTIVLETIYGHAVKKLLLPDGEKAVQFFPKNRG